MGDATTPTTTDRRADPRRPRVKLTGKDGNAFAIMGRVSDALRRAGYTEAEREAYMVEATAGDYSRLLVVSCQWADVR